MGNGKDFINFEFRYAQFTAYNFIYLFIWDFTSLSTLYRSYHDGYLEG